MRITLAYLIQILIHVYRMAVVELKRCRLGQCKHLKMLARSEILSLRRRKEVKRWSIATAYACLMQGKYCKVCYCMQSINDVNFLQKLFIFCFRIDSFYLWNTFWVKHESHQNLCLHIIKGIVIRKLRGSWAESPLEHTIWEVECGKWVYSSWQA